MPAIEPSAIDALRALNPGDDSFLRDLIQIYFDDAPKRLVEIEQAVAEKDARKLTLAAHSLKGSSSNFGANQLRLLSEELEQLGRQSALDGVAALVPPLKAEYARVEAELTALLPPG